MQARKPKAPKAPKFHATASMEMETLNALVPNTRYETFEGKTVIVRRSFFGLTDYGLGDRRFFATGGFGCYPDKIGTAVFGYFLSDGESARIERFDVDGLAVNVATEEHHALNKAWEQARYPNE